jgi:hypothetical protein
MSSTGVIKNGQSRETGNIGYTKRRKTNLRHNTICVGHNYSQRSTYNVNKTCAHQQTTIVKDEPNIVFMRKSLWTSQYGTQNVKTHTNKTTQKLKR